MKENLSDVAVNLFPDVSSMSVEWFDSIEFNGRTFVLDFIIRGFPSRERFDVDSCEMLNGRDVVLEKLSKVVERRRAELIAVS